MIGLDTNVIVRYVVQDNPDQAVLATKTMEGLTDQEPGFVSVVTVAEISWVLRRAYRLELNAVLDVIEGLINVRELRVEGVDAIRRAVDRARAGGEFADCLIAELGHAAGCATTLTFDRGAAGQSGYVADRLTAWSTRECNGTGPDGRVISRRPSSSVRPGRLGPRLLVLKSGGDLAPLPPILWR